METAKGLYVAERGMFEVSNISLLRISLAVLRRSHMLLAPVARLLSMFCCVSEVARPLVISVYGAHLINFFPVAIAVYACMGSASDFELTSHCTLFVNYSILCFPFLSLFCLCPYS